MNEQETTLSVQEIIQLASGKDSGGSPRSAASLSIDLIDQAEMDCLQEEVLDQALFQIHMSGGAVAITADFPVLSRASYLRSLDLCQGYLSSLEDPAHDQEQLSMTVVPFLLEGQIVLHFTQLVFCDGYDKDGYLRLILVFDNLASSFMETDQVDYAAIHRDIDLELKRYEEEIDDEIEQALEEEKEAKRQENLIEQRMKERLNHPFSKQGINPEKQRESEESPNVRFVDGEDSHEK